MLIPMFYVLNIMEKPIFKVFMHATMQNLANSVVYGDLTWDDGMRHMSILIVVHV